MSALIVFLFAIVLISPTSAAVFPRQTPISNSTTISTTKNFYRTSTITASAPSGGPKFPISGGACCFVVQETVEVKYFAHYSTSTWYGLRNVTSFITSITHFIDTAVTNTYTTTTAINATYEKSWDIAAPQIPARNKAGSDQSTSVAELNGTAVVTGGVTVQSPQAFYVYATANVFRVPAMTDKNGNEACTTTSTDSVVCTFPVYHSCNSNYPSHTTILPAEASSNCSTLSFFTTHLSDNIFPGINTWAEGYFGGVAVGITTTANTTVAPITATYDHIVVTFSTPFIYQPLRGKGPNLGSEYHQIGRANGNPASGAQKRALTPATELTSNDGAVEDFGYVPQTLIDWMAQNPDYDAQFPGGLKDCLPGGPSILPFDTCGPQAAPGTLDAVPDLTLNQAFTVQGEGCFHPGACPTAQATVGVGAIQATPAAAAAHNNPPPTQTAVPSSSQGPAGIQLGSQPLKPSSKGDVASGTQPTGSQQEPPKQETPPEHQSAQPASPQTTIQPIPIVPTIIGEATSTSVTPIQPQPQPNNPATSKDSSPNDQNQNQNNTPSPKPDSARPPSNNNAPELIPPNIASAIMAGFGPSPASPSPTPAVKGGYTVTPGSPPVTISSTTYSVPPSGTAVIINGTPSPLPAQAGSGKAPPFVAGGATLTPGSPSVTISGTTYSVAPSGTAVVVNGETSLPARPDTNTIAPVVEGGLTLIPGGGAVTVSGTTYSAPTEGAAVVVNGATSSLPTLSGTATPASPAETAQPALIIASQTLVPGAAITVSGTVISFPSSPASAGNEVVVGGSTETFAAPSAGGAGGGAVVINIGTGLVNASFVPPAPSAGSGGDVGGGNGIGSATAGGNGTNGYTGPGFVSGARRRVGDVWWSGWILGVIPFGVAML